MTDHVPTPARVLSEEAALRAATMHRLYQYLLQLAARKQAAARAKARDHTRTATDDAPAVKPEAQPQLYHERAETQESGAAQHSTEVQEDGTAATA